MTEDQLDSLVTLIEAVIFKRKRSPFTPEGTYRQLIDESRASVLAAFRVGDEVPAAVAGVGDWVACSDCMPSNGHTVLVCGKNADGAPRYGVAYWTVNRWCPVGVVGISSATYVLLGLIPTHWRWLPEVPK